MITVNYDAWTSVANIALAKLGREKLSAMTEDTPDAGYCRDFIPEAISICTEYFDWSFLMKEDRLYPNYTFDGRNSFGLPSRVARLSMVDAEGMDFEIINDRIVTDGSYCTVRYLSYPSKPQDIRSGQFMAALENYLAYMLSKPLSGNDALSGELYQLFLASIEQARLNDRSYLIGSAKPKNRTKWWTEEIIHG